MRERGKREREKTKKKNIKFEGQTHEGDIVDPVSGRTLEGCFPEKAQSSGLLAIVEEGVHVDPVAAVLLTEAAHPERTVTVR